MTAYDGRKNNKGRWVKGQTGNPLGKSKLEVRNLRHIAALAREHTAAAMRVIVGMLDSRKRGIPPAVRLRAAEVIIERGYGRTPAVVEILARPVETLTDAELISIASGGGERIIAPEEGEGELPSLH